MRGKSKPVDPTIELVKVDEAERALVSILLNFPEQAMLSFAGQNFLTSDIYDPWLRKIADIVLAQVSRNKSTDVRVVYELIREHQPMEFSALTELYIVLPVLAPIKEFIDIVRTASKRRALQIVLHEAQSSVKQGELPAFISSLVASAEGIGDQINPPKTADTKAQYLEALTRYESGDDKAHRMRTGFNALDNITPIKESDFVVVGGETKSGKTTFVLNIIAHILDANAKNQTR